jgi:hypothetical protein
MTLLVSDVAQDVFAFLGRPSQSALRFRDLIDSGSREVGSLVIDLFNADRDYRVEPVTNFLPTGRDVLFPYEGEIVRLEGRERTSTSDDDWEEWHRGADFSTYGAADGTHIVFPEDPSTYGFRALVERGSVRFSSLADDTTLTTLVQPLLFAHWALEAGAMVDDDSDRWEKLWARKERHLRLKLPGLERQWKAYVERNRGEGVYQKEGFQSSGVDEFQAVHRDGQGDLRAS